MDSASRQRLRVNAEAFRFRDWSRDDHTILQDAGGQGERAVATANTMLEALHIEAWDPATCIALLDRLDEAERLLGEAMAMFGQWPAIAATHELHALEERIDAALAAAEGER